MTDLDLDAIEKRAAAATPGPWRRCDASGGTCVCGLVWSVPVDVTVAQALDERSSCEGELHDGARITNGNFIAAARTDVPALCAALRAARAEVERITVVCDRQSKIYGETHVKLCEVADEKRALVDERDWFRSQHATALEYWRAEVDAMRTALSSVLDIGDARPDVGQLWDVLVDDIKELLADCGGKEQP